MGAWNAYGNEYWPADYLIDASGQVRYATFGEGDYAKTGPAIALIADPDATSPPTSHPTDVIVPSQEAAPETYLGTARGQGWVAGPSKGWATTAPGTPGRWKSTTCLLRNLARRRPARHRRLERRIDVQFEAKHIYLVLSWTGNVRDGAGAARRPADLGRGRGGGRAQGLRHGRGRASVYARLASSRRTAPAVPALRSWGHGICVFVWVGQASTSGGDSSTGSSPPRAFR